mmetsp:Transcript_30196/g.86195  ORF Transcript_30196/g.86195 Transcript_30196/m.86195 type:complete len:424 (-) Transcript_30196:94-1365(-)
MAEAEQHRLGAGVHVWRAPWILLSCRGVRRRRVGPHLLVQVDSRPEVRVAGGVAPPALSRCPPGRPWGGDREVPDLSRPRAGPGGLSLRPGGVRGAGVGRPEVAAVVGRDDVAAVAGVQRAARRAALLGVHHDGDGRAPVRRPRAVLESRVGDPDSPRCWPAGAAARSREDAAAGDQRLLAPHEGPDHVADDVLGRGRVQRFPLRPQRRAAPRVFAGGGRGQERPRGDLRLPAVPPPRHAVREPADFVRAARGRDPQHLPETLRASGPRGVHVRALAHGCGERHEEPGPAKREPLYAALPQDEARGGHRQRHGRPTLDTRGARLGRGAHAAVRPAVARVGAAPDAPRLGRRGAGRGGRHGAGRPLGGAARGAGPGAVHGGPQGAGLHRGDVLERRRMTQGGREPLRDACSGPARPRGNVCLFT